MSEVRRLFFTILKCVQKLVLFSLIIITAVLLNIDDLRWVASSCINDFWVSCLRAVFVFEHVLSCLEMCAEILMILSIHIIWLGYLIERSILRIKALAGESITFETVVAVHLFGLPPYLFHHGIIVMLAGMVAFLCLWKHIIEKLITVGLQYFIDR